MKGIFDADGCLIGGGNSKEEREARSEIGELIESQILDEGVIATGRGPEYALALAKVFGFRRGIAEHGAFFILNADDDVVIENPMIQEDDRFLSVDRFEAFLRGFGARLYRGKSFCLAGYPPAGMAPKELYEEAIKAFPYGPGQFTYSDLGVDWMLANLDKGSSLISFTNTFAPDINLLDCFGIGDSWADISWLKLLGNRIACPENSSPECKDFVRERHGYVAKGKFAQGTLEATRHFLGIQVPQGVQE